MTLPAFGQPIARIDIDLADVLDVNIVAPAAGDILIYDGDSWDNQPVSGDITITAAGVTAISPGVIVDADISAAAEIAVSKFADGAPRQVLQTDVAGTGVEWTDNVDLPGTLDVTGIGTFDDVVNLDADAVMTSSALRWDGGVAVVAGEYSIQRDADATNQMHFNVPTGAGWEWSINDVAEIVYTTGGWAFQQATTISTTTGNITIAAAADDDVQLGDGTVIVHIDGLTERVAIGSGVSASSSGLLTMRDMSTSVAASYGIFQIGTITLDADRTSWYGWGNGGPIIATTGSNFNLTTLAAVGITPSAFAKTGAGTIANAVGLYIADAPTIGGTLNLSFWVDAGPSRLDGSLFVEAAPTEGAAGEQLTSGGAGAVMNWSAAASLGKFKNTLGMLDPQTALKKILSWEPRRFQYRTDAEISTHDHDTVYAGVYGEDAPEVMHHEGSIFSAVSAFGYTVGAIQAMEQEIIGLRKRVELLAA